MSTQLEAEPCRVCGCRFVRVEPFPRSVKWWRARCLKCGQTGTPGIDEAETLEQWAKCQKSATAFRKRSSVKIERKPRPKRTEPVETERLARQLNLFELE